MTHSTSDDSRRTDPFGARTANTVTARTLNASKAGRGVKRFKTKKALYTGLGL